MAIVSETEELDIFRTDIIKDYIDFKWNCIGVAHHTRGFLTHVAFIIFLIFYTNYVYIEASLQDEFLKPNYVAFNINPAAVVFPVMWLYPVLYETVQLF